MKAGVAGYMLISIKVDFRTKTITRDKEGHFSPTWFGSAEGHFIIIKGLFIHEAKAHGTARSYRHSHNYDISALLSLSLSSPPPTLSPSNSKNK